MSKEYRIDSIRMTAKKNSTRKVLYLLHQINGDWLVCVYKSYSLARVAAKKVELETCHA
jgi:hypothetical protein